jgi:hypothetical protein
MKNPGTRKPGRRATSKTTLSSFLTRKNAINQSLECKNSGLFVNREVLKSSLQKIRIR